MKKISALVTAVLILFCTITVLASECVLNETYESGILSSNWTVSKGSAKIVNVGESKCLELTAETAMTKVLDESVVGTNVEISADLKIKKLDTNNEQSYIRLDIRGDSTLPNDPFLYGLRINNNYLVSGLSRPRVDILKGGSWEKISPAPEILNDTFVPVKIILNTVERKIRIIVAGIPYPADVGGVAQWATISTADYPPEIKVKRIMLYSNGWSTSTTAIDNLKIVSNVDYTPSINFTNASNTKIDKLENGVITGTVQARNLSEQERNYLVGLSLFKDGVLEDFVYNYVNIPVGTNDKISIPVSINIPEGSLEGYKIEGYILKDITSLIALTSQVVLSP